ncbi:hypothetical protein SAMN05444581_101392 [Methylocapsa palsarum]|uniref:Uncharacterized protein n=1 Tax=Methylocapsa palsarum TaxID=1612308 RepID=A0A1I3W9Y0_9HYPH|nr:hypothetical protein SAMN05444581_101392 [Methylocapsa palsarum]
MVKMTKMNKIKDYWYSKLRMWQPWILMETHAPKSHTHCSNMPQYKNRVYLAQAAQRKRSHTSRGVA